MSFVRISQAYHCSQIEVIARLSLCCHCCSKSRQTLAMSAASGPSRADLDRKSFSLNLLAPSFLRRLSLLRKHGDDEAKGAPAKACPAHIAQTINCNAVVHIIICIVSSKCTRACVTHTLDGTHRFAWHEAKLFASYKADSHLMACKLRQVAGRAAGWQRGPRKLWQSQCRVNTAWPCVLRWCGSQQHRWPQVLSTPPAQHAHHSARHRHKGAMLK